MAGNTGILAQEYVVFLSQGLSEVGADIKSVEKQLDLFSHQSMEAQAQVTSLKAALDTGAYIKFAAGAALAKQELADLREKAHGIDLTTMFGKGRAEVMLYHEHLNSLKSGLGDVAEANATLKKQLGTGEYEKLANITNYLSKQQEDLAKQARAIDLRVQFGEAGAAAIEYKEHLNSLRAGMGDIQAANEKMKSQLAISGPTAGGGNVKPSGISEYEALANITNHLKKEQADLAAQAKAIDLTAGFPQATQAVRDHVASLEKLKAGLGEVYMTNEKLRQSVVSGHYAEVAKQQAALSQQSRMLAEQTKKIDLEAQFGKFGATMGSLGDKLKGFASQFESMTRGVVIGIAAAQAGIMGFVRSGLQGTGAGAMLSFQFEQLSRQIASVFLPTIEAITEKISQLVGWFKNLTRDQQDSIRRWVEAAAAAGLVLAIFPKVVSAIGSVGKAIGALGGQMGFLSVMTGGIVPLLGILVTGITAIMVGTEAGRDAIGQFAEKFKPLIDVVMKLADTLMGALSDGIGKAVDAISGVLSSVISDLQPILAVVMDSFKIFIDLVMQVIPPVMAIVKALMPAVTILFQLGGVIQKLTFAPLIAAFKALAPVIEIIGKILELFVIRPAMIVMELINGLADVFGDIMGIIGDLAGEIMGLGLETLKPIFDFILGIIKVSIEGIKSFISWIREAIADLRRFLGLKMPEAKKEKPRSEVGNPGGGFEDIGESFRRIQSAVSDSSRTANATEEIARNTRPRVERDTGVRTIPE